MAEEARPRTATRLRGEAPPGLQFTGEEGRQHIGRYEVIKTIGKGAMGVVYKARDPLLDRVVAVKTIMSPQGQGRRVRSAFLERFQREAKAAAKMQHPAIVTIFDVGVDEESGAPFMVLEYLPGESLADRLDRVRFPLARSVQIALDLASALSFAHRQRIVHRDVKPANVLHAGDNRWKLADFGIARMPDSDLTQVGIFMGTPGYSPPEAIREGRYTPQADVFAWGAVFYELLSGRIPYEGPDTKTTNSYVVQGNAPSPARHDASIPEPLATVTMTALQSSDRARFKDSSEAEQALRDAWDRCLTQGLVHPAVLAMDETSHDKVGSRMHEARGIARSSVAVPIQPHDSAELTVDEDLPNTPLTIESKKQRITDDDPTMLQVRVEDMRNMDTAARATERPSGKAKALEVDRATERSTGKLKAQVAEPDPADVPLPGGGAVAGSSGQHPIDDIAATQSEAKLGTSAGRTIAEPARSRLSLILAMVIIAIVAVVVAAYLRGMIKI
ncbi:MAG TPA: serine/threonine-protein kinase [Kofleriaceae bacterium]|jgi:serine/threonine-protein kinase|nr:serine/threonine-protein kinase [Kofleriaceae bacterium]